MKIKKKKELSSQKVFFELAFIPKKFPNQVKESIFCPAFCTVLSAGVIR